MNRFLYCFLFLLIIGCGGGGSEGVEDFSGRYDVALVLTETSCSGTNPTFESPVIVAQEGAQVRGAYGTPSAPGANAVGPVRADGTGFTLASSSTTDAQGCPRTDVAEYFIQAESELLVVEYRFEIDCGRFSRCSATFEGTARRVD